jgi:hypothetical protein
LKAFLQEKYQYPQITEYEVNCHLSACDYSTQMSSLFSFGIAHGCTPEKTNKFVALLVEVELCILSAAGVMKSSRGMHSCMLWGL